MTVAYRPDVGRWGAERFDLAPLEDLLGRPSMSQLARTLRIDRRQLYRMRQRGLTVPRADGFAVAAGFHPGDVWPEWWAADS